MTNAIAWRLRPRSLPFNPDHYPLTPRIRAAVKRAVRQAPDDMKATNFAAGADDVVTERFRPARARGLHALAFEVDLIRQLAHCDAVRFQCLLCDGVVNAESVVVGHMAGGGRQLHDGARTCTSYSLPQIRSCFRVLFLECRQL